MRILGIDPGSRKTGFGLIDVNGSKLTYVSSGCIRLGDKPMHDRLKMIHQGIQQIIEQHSPTVVGLEKVFMNNNPESALKLGQARGVALCAAVLMDLNVHEYSATKVKSVVVGQGHASKEQVQFMVKRLLDVKGDLQEDAADALAVAICHAHNRGTSEMTQQSKNKWGFDSSRIVGGA